MSVSLNALVEMLDITFEREDETFNPTFTNLEVLMFPSTNLREDTLYVCLLSEALQLDKTKRHSTFLCVRDRMIDASETAENMRGILVATVNLHLRELFNKVQAAFFQHLHWELAMQKSVAQNNGIQDLLNLSESIIKNHIDVMDSAFKLIAYTKNTPIDDVTTNNLINLGYHNEETFEKFKRHRRFEQFSNASDIIVSSDHLISEEFTTVKKIFHKNESYVLLVVMVCHKRTSEGVLDLFKTLTEYIRYYIDNKTDLELNTPLASLACSILNNETTDQKQIAESASGINAPFKGEFGLSLIQITDTKNLPLDRMISRISATIQHAFVFRYKNNIVIFQQNITHTQYQEHSLNMLKRICSQLDQAVCYIGISNPFRFLYELPIAYNQALAAICFGKNFTNDDKPHYNLTSKIVVYYFEDYSLYYEHYLIRKNSQNYSVNGISDYIIRTLQEQEHHYNVPYLQILYTYIHCESRATLAAKKLNMHRNTVIYHIDRMEELLDISLKEPDTRQKFLFGFKAYELKDFSLPEQEFCKI